MWNSSDWFESIKSGIAGTAQSRSEYFTNSGVVPENYQKSRKEQTKIQALAHAICMQLDWQENRMRLKVEAKERAIRRRYAQNQNIPSPD